MYFLTPCPYLLRNKQFDSVLNALFLLLNTRLLQVAITPAFGEPLRLGSFGTDFATFKKPVSQTDRDCLAVLDGIRHLSVLRLWQEEGEDAGREGRHAEDHDGKRGVDHLVRKTKFRTFKQDWARKCCRFPQLRGVHLVGAVRFGASSMEVMHFSYIYAHFLPCRNKEIWLKLIQ